MLDFLAVDVNFSMTGGVGVKSSVDLACSVANANRTASSESELPLVVVVVRVCLLA